MVTAGINALPTLEQAVILETVRIFSDFNEENDPRGEHDFGNFQSAGHYVFWKIDCYDKAMEGGSEDPGDPEKTERVLTIMLANEY